MSTPDEIKVGDMVEHKEFVPHWSLPIWKVVAICGGYAWIQHEDHAPRTTWLRHIRKPASKPVVEQHTIFGNPCPGNNQDVDWGLEQVGRDTHKITFNIVDGAPDFTSIKLEEL